MSKRWNVCCPLGWWSGPCRERRNRKGLASNSFTILEESFSLICFDICYCMLFVIVTFLYILLHMLSHKTEDLAGKPTRNSAGETLGCQVLFPFLVS